MKKDDKNYWRSMIPVIVVVFGLMVRVGSATAACVIQDSSGQPVQNNNDPLAKVLLADGACPVNVFELRSHLLDLCAKIKTTLVANRGFHNPKTDSQSMHFMMFEIVSGRLDSLGIDISDGEFFFGHFTANKGVDTLFADQRPDPRNLMIELIAFDPMKQVFNFYEPIGDGQKGQWVYRGDSLDIQADVQFLLGNQTQTNHRHSAIVSGVRLAT